MHKYKMFFIPFCAGLLHLPLIMGMPRPSSSASPSQDLPYCSSPWTMACKWNVIWITLLTVLPWAIVAVFDAIDSNYRGRNAVALRLFFSSVCNVTAYTFGIWYIVVLARNDARDDSRFDQIATVVVLLVFNVWHFARNIRGWAQFYALSFLRPAFVKMQKQFHISAPYISAPHSKGQLILGGLKYIRISDRLIDNDFTTTTPFLYIPTTPFIQRKRVSHQDAGTEAWAVACWRAWWSQETYGLVTDMTAPAGFLCDKEHRHVDAQGLLHSEQGTRYNFLDQV